jgi:hypothetical protein
MMYVKVWEGERVEREWERGWGDEWMRREGSWKRTFCRFAVTLFLSLAVESAILAGGEVQGARGCAEPILPGYSTVAALSGNPIRYEDDQSILEHRGFDHSMATQVGRCSLFQI